MNAISDKIKSGARAFLVTEYKYLAFYAVIVTVILVIMYSLDPPSGSVTDGIRYGACFLAGSILSASAGWAGMAVATVRILLRHSVFPFCCLACLFRF
jgi:K(+)-stimulated pyrophosphate-energized sodium pump